MYGSINFLQRWASFHLLIATAVCFYASHLRFTDAVQLNWGNERASTKGYWFVHKDSPLLLEALRIVNRRIEGNVCIM